MSNDITKIEQFEKQVLEVLTDYEVSTGKTNNILGYILEIISITTKQQDDHPDGTCHAETHSENGHHDSHTDTHPDCGKQHLLGENE